MHLICCYPLMFPDCFLQGSGYLHSLLSSLFALPSSNSNILFFFPRLLSCLFNLLNLEFHPPPPPPNFCHHLSFLFSLWPRLLSQTPCSSEPKHQSVCRRSFSHSFHTDSSVLTKPKSHLPLRGHARQPCPKVMLFPPISFHLILSSVLGEQCIQ